MELEELAVENKDGERRERLRLPCDYRRLPYDCRTGPVRLPYDSRSTMTGPTGYSLAPKPGPRAYAAGCWMLAAGVGAITQTTWLQRVRVAGLPGPEENGMFSRPTGPE